MVLLLFFPGHLHVQLQMLKKTKYMLYFREKAALVAYVLQTLNLLRLQSYTEVPKSESR